MKSLRLIRPFKLVLSEADFFVQCERSIRPVDLVLSEVFFCGQSRFKKVLYYKTKLCSCHTNQRHALCKNNLTFLT